MKCALCKKPIEDDAYYASVDVWELASKQYFAMNCCMDCAANLRKNAKQYTIDIHRFKNYKVVATTPMRASHGPWLFAKSEVEGIDYNDGLRLAWRI